MKRKEELRGLTGRELERVSDDTPYFWLGEHASKVSWFYQNYSGIALRCHLAMVPGDITY